MTTFAAEPVALTESREGYQLDARKFLQRLKTSILPYSVHFVFQLSNCFPLEKDGKVHGSVEYLKIPEIICAVLLPKGDFERLVTPE